MIFIYMIFVYMIFAYIYLLLVEKYNHYSFFDSINLVFKVRV